MESVVPAGGHDVPGRKEVRWWWHRLSDGLVARGEAHRWAARWLEGGDFIWSATRLLA
jgi:hypothetical protein